MKRLITFAFSCLIFAGCVFSEPKDSFFRGGTGNGQAMLVTTTFETNKVPVPKISESFSFSCAALHWGVDEFGQSVPVQCPDQSNPEPIGWKVTVTPRYFFRIGSNYLSSTGEPVHYLETNTPAIK